MYNFKKVENNFFDKITKPKALHQECQSWLPLSCLMATFFHDAKFSFQVVHGIQNKDLSIYANE